MKIEGGSAGLDGRKSIVGVRDSAEGGSAKGLGEGGERLGRLGGHRERSRWTVLAGAARGVMGAHARRQRWGGKKRREGEGGREREQESAEGVGGRSEQVAVDQARTTTDDRPVTGQERAQSASASASRLQTVESESARVMPGLAQVRCTVHVRICPCPAAPLALFEARARPTRLPRASRSARGCAGRARSCAGGAVCFGSLLHQAGSAQAGGVANYSSLDSRCRASAGARPGHRSRARRCRCREHQHSPHATPR